MHDAKVAAQSLAFGRLQPTNVKVGAVEATVFIGFTGEIDDAQSDI